MTDDESSDNYEAELFWELNEDAISKIFNVWIPQDNELRFAKEAWGHIIREWKNIAESILIDDDGNEIVETMLYRDGGEIDECYEKIAFMTLGCMYLDFCKCAWDEEVDPFLGDWADDLKIEPFILGQISQEHATENKLYATDEIGNALNVIIDDLRPIVFKALCKGYGDTIEVYKAFYRSHILPVYEDEEMENTFSNTSSLLRGFAPSDFIEGALCLVENGF